MKYLLSLFIAMSITLCCAEEYLFLPFKETWNYDFNESIKDVVVVNNKIFLVGDNTFQVLNAPTGKVLLRKIIPNVGYETPGIVQDRNRVYIATKGKQIRAYNIQTLQQEWSIRIDGSIESLAAGQNKLFIEKDEYTLAALSGAKHEILWELDKAKLKAPISYEDHYKFIVIKQKLIIYDNEGRIFCIDVNTGKEIWRKNYVQQSKKLHLKNIIADNEKLYISIHEIGLIALDIKTGEKDWHYEIDGINNAILMEDYILFIHDAGILHACIRQTGKLAWSTILPSWGDNSAVPAAYHQIILVSGIFAYDNYGKKIWEWLTGIEHFRFISSNGKALFINDSKIAHYEMDNNIFDAKDFDKQAIIKKLLSHFDTLNDGQKAMLKSMGEEAFELVFPIIKEKITLFDKKFALKNNNNAEYEQDYIKVNDLLSILTPIISESHTTILISIFNNCESAYLKQRMLEIIVANGEKDKTVEWCLKLLDQIASDSDLYQIAWRYLADSKNPAVIEYITTHISSENTCKYACNDMIGDLSNTEIRKEVDNLFARNKPDRSIPSLYHFLQMDELSTVPVKRKDRLHQILCCPPELLELRKDKEGNLWGLIQSFILGENDFWLAKYDGALWTDVWFIGISKETVDKKSWNSALMKESDISKDSDGDSWTDLVEKRIGTDPHNPDTDGDELKDSEDKNPLVAPRALSEIEQIVANALDCFFKYKSLIQIGKEAYGGKSNPYIGVKVPVLVELPKGVEPFEIPGATWISVTAKSGTHHYIGSQSMLLRFPPPWPEFIPELKNERGHRILENNFILWNEDRTEVTLNLEEYHGELAQRWYDVLLKKVNGQWLVIYIYQYAES